MSDNKKDERMRIWNAGSMSNSKAISKSKDQNGNSSINAYYMIEKATEIFGPVGEGWGYDIIEDRIDDGKPVMVGDQVILEKNHTIRLKLWHGDRNQYVEHYGHTKMLYWSHKNKYWINDDEAPKKSLTDAIKKCLSVLGIYADVFKGMMDDIEYRNEKDTHQMIEQAENRQEEIDRQIQEMREYVEDHKSMMQAAGNVTALNSIMRKTETKLLALGKINGLFDSAEKARANLARCFKKVEQELLENK